MIDKTDILIKDKLNSVESNPPIGLWEKLEPEIDALNNQAFDEAVKDKLHDVADNPSAGLYSTIAKSLAKQRLFYRLKIAGAAASVILIAALFFINNEKEIGYFDFIEPQGTKISDANIDNDKELAKADIKEKAAEYPISNNQSSISQDDENKSNQIEKSLGKSSSGEKISNQITEDNEVSNNIVENISLADNSETQEVTINETQETSKKTSFSLNQFRQKYGGDNLIINKKLTPDNLITDKLSSLKKDYYGVNSDKDKSKSSIKRNPRFINKYSLGVNYSPTALYLGDNLGLNHSLGLDLKYQNVNLIVQSGVIFEYVREEADYALDYNKYEFQKKQLMFDSLDFTSVDNLGRPTPVNPYYVDVYDSSNYVYNSVAKDHYVVLKIPLMIGYQWNKRDFGMFVKAGFSYNLNVYKRRTGVYKLDANSTQNSFYYPVNNLYESNFEYLFSSGFDYHIRHNISFTSEFIAKYYQNPIYQNMDFKNSFGLGLKLGILYEL